MVIFFIVHYIILNNGILKSDSSIFPRSEEYITQYTPQEVYGLIVNENYEINVSLMIVKMIQCPYQDSTGDIRSNITLCLQEFPWALLSGTSSGRGVYFTVYPSSCPNTDTIFPRSEGYITQHTPQGVYGLIFNENNEVNVSLMIVKMIQWPYQDLTSGVPSAFALGNSLWQRVIYDLISLVSS